MSSTITSSQTMIEQWEELKSLHPDSLLLFQLGDFFEAFYEDAITLGNAISIVVTKRQNIPMAGIPISQLDNYIEDIVAYANKVIIAEQLPKTSDKGMVSRQITRVITPGTLIEKAMKRPKNHMFLACLSYVNRKFGIVYSDLSTGEMFGDEVIHMHDVIVSLVKNMPSELIIATSIPLEEYSAIYNTCINEHISVNQERIAASLSQAERYVSAFFKISNTIALGMKDKDALKIAAFNIISYISTTCPKILNFIKTIKVKSINQHMLLPKSTLKSLDLILSQNNGNAHGTLFGILDNTITSQGSRLLKIWTANPLVDKIAINHRMAQVEMMCKTKHFISHVQEELRKIPDFYRLLSKTASASFNPQDMLKLTQGLCIAKKIFSILNKYNFHQLDLYQSLNNVSELVLAISDKIASPAPAKITGDSPIFKPGLYKDLDEFYYIKNHNTDAIQEYCVEIANQYDLKSVKSGTNKIIGTFIEIPKSQASKIDLDEFKIIQTLSTSIRCTSPKLKSIATHHDHAEASIIKLETAYLDDLVRIITNETKAIQAVAEATAMLDCIQSLAFLALQNNFIRPNFNDDKIIDIKKAFHPVVTKLMPDRFVKNDIYMSPNSRCIFITGPNMAGKSTYIRQTALISIMAQIGSFVPAKEASLPILSSIFTRIGAQDNITEGMSTFMIEMTETAMVLNNMDSNSLIILDEIGRGTCPEEGEGLAKAILMYILDNTDKPLVMFATHYHNLASEIPKSHVQFKTFDCSISETNNIIFHYTIRDGIATHSYALYTARLAGIPNVILQNAENYIARKNPS